MVMVAVDVPVDATGPSNPPYSTMYPPTLALSGKSFQSPVG
jgi:hypothetical protein